MSSQVRNLRVNARGRAAVWIGDDDEPWKYPRDNLDRVKFHTALDYIQVVQEVNLTLSLPRLDHAGSERSQVHTYPLFDHGRGGFPFVLGKIEVGGVRVGFAGSIPVQRYSNDSFPVLQQFARWLTLGADDTSVYIHEYAVFGGGYYNAIDLPITIYVTNELLDVDTPRPPVGSASRITMRRAQFADGLFDTNKQYIRQVANPADKEMSLVRGPSVEANLVSFSSNGYEAWRWRMGDATLSGTNGVSSALDPETNPSTIPPLTIPDGFNVPLDISLGGGDAPAGPRDSFRASGGRIRMAAGGKARFDTDDGLFHTIDTLSGTIPVGTLSFASDTQYNLTDDVDLGPCDANCTDVIGSIKFTLASYAAGLAYDQWVSMFGGSTAMWVMDGFSLSPMASVVQLVWYSFFIDSGRVKLRRRAVCSDQSTGTYSVLAHTIDYKIKTGLFT